MRVHVGWIGCVDIHVDIDMRLSAAVLFPLRAWPQRGGDRVLREGGHDVCGRVCDQPQVDECGGVQPGRPAAVDLLPVGECDPRLTKV